MAELAVFDIAWSIGKSLGSLVLQEIELFGGFKDEVRKLGNTVSTIQAVLLDAEEKQAQNHAVRDWLGKLKDAMYEADDLLDDYSTELLRRQVMTQDKKAKQVCVFFSKSNQLGYGLKMGQRIKAIRKRLQEITANRLTFDLIERPIVMQPEHKKREEDAHSFILNEEVIGREDVKEDVKKLLLDSNTEENVSIIPIVGIGGQGKTTIAKYVFNDEQVQNHFELKVWVCVSDPFSMKTIVQQLIESATKTRPKSFEMEPLQSKLREIIGGKRFLLILDDVWNENHDSWLNLKTLLMGGSRGSKVLITTRSMRVAEITGTVLPYVLGGLSENSSWDLFKKLAFKNGEEPKNQELVKIGRKIVGKCARVPLFIRSIGCMLCSSEISVEYWSYIEKNELLKVTQHKNDIIPILKLSYDHLPLHLKQCFVFCSLFPKDYRIKVEALIQLWIAQGFVCSLDENRRLEDVGHEYFLDLLWRSFFQEPYRDEYDDIKSCKMHDLIHDFAQFIARNECKILDSNVKEIGERTCHVAVDPVHSFSDIPTFLFKANRMRTLILGGDFQCIGGNKSIYDTLISNFKCLRALNLSNLDITEVSNSIGKLKHLRFLDLSRNDGIKLLPTSITKLQNLQTLNLEFCWSLTKLPEDMSNLISLRHLNLSWCDRLRHMPPGLKKLTALQTLSDYILGKKESHVLKPEGGLLSELNGLNELRGSLCIKGLQHLRSYPVEAKAANLERKQYLQHLELRWDLGAQNNIDNDEQLLQNIQPHQNLKHILIEEYAGMRFPSWMSSLSNLVHLSIMSCRECQHIPALNQFPSLKRLYLDHLSELEYIGNDDSDVSSFSLESITLQELPNLKGWWRRRIETVTAEYEPHHHFPLFPSFPCLSELCISNCPEMSLIIPALAPGCETIPSSSSPFSNLSKLKSLKLHGLDELEYLPEEWLQNLTSLVKLDILDCRKLRISMSPLFQHLTALEYLGIGDCGELISNEDEEGVQCFGPTRLRRLHIRNLVSLSLPRELRHATTLQRLEIEYCPILMSLPEWIGDFTSLETLQILDCQNLKSLPDWMHRLTSLRNLTIEYCPRLKERCQEGIGEDWPKIAHIPNFLSRRLY